MTDEICTYSHVKSLHSLYTGRCWRGRTKEGLCKCRSFTPAERENND